VARPQFLSLLKKKRLLDAIEKLRQTAPAGQTEFTISCGNLCRAIHTHTWGPFNSLLKAIESEGAAKFAVASSFGGSPWGESSVTINIADEFDEIYKRLGEEYHNTNNKLGRNKEKRVGIIEAGRENQYIDCEGTPRVMADMR